MYRKKGNDLLFYVPSNIESHVLFKYHNQMGHLGFAKTKEFISKIYWFPKLNEKIDSHIKNCLKCISFTSSSGKVEVSMHIVPKGDVPFATLHIDHFGPIVGTNVKIARKHLFLIVDAFTKFVNLFDTKTTSSQEAINCLKQYFQNYSKPSAIISDRGSTFTSLEFIDFVSENHVKHLLIATGSPQANGQVARVNRVMVPMLAKLTDDKKGEYWPKILKHLEYSLKGVF